MYVWMSEGNENKKGKRILEGEPIEHIMGNARSRAHTIIITPVRGDIVKSTIEPGAQTPNAALYGSCLAH